MQHEGGEERVTGQPPRDVVESIADSISAQAAKRIAGREEVVGRICEVARAQAAKHNLRVNEISIHAAWSHEYDENTGVVVDVNVTASDEDRFSYWEALNEGLDELAASLPQNDCDWLQSELSLTVIRAYRCPSLRRAFMIWPCG